jgi:phage/plasmid-associated DNA primase
MITTQMNRGTDIFVTNGESENELNKNPFLIGFENGVYDLDKMEFRDRLSLDGRTMSVGYDYISEYTEHKDELIEFLKDILPNRDDRIFLLKYISTGLCALTYDKNVVILIGKPMSGKTRLKELISCTLGNYYLTFSNKLLTIPRPSPEKVSPEILALQNKRFAMCDVSDFVRINNSGFKFITDNEPMMARGLYDEKVTIVKPTHKIGLICNSLPRFENPNDPAVQTHIRCIEFPTTFVTNPTKPNEKLIDKMIGEKLELWKQDFILLLIEYFALFKHEGLIETTNMYKFMKSMQILQYEKMN